MAGRLMLLGALLAAMAAEAAGDDPTRPAQRGRTEAADGAAPSRAPVLQSILIGGQRRIAVIDGVARRVGDPVGDAEVIAIEADRVRLRGPEGVTQLPLLRPFPAPPPPGQDPASPPPPRKDPP